MTRKTAKKLPRKTTRERLLYAELKGFCDCLHIFEEKWRDDAWKKHHAGIKLDPATDEMWKLIQTATAKIRPVDDEYRALRDGRVSKRYLSEKED
jgi:hypothetical protein